MFVQCVRLNRLSVELNWTHSKSLQFHSFIHSFIHRTRYIRTVFTVCSVYIKLMSLSFLLVSSCRRRHIALKLPTWLLCGYVRLSVCYIPWMRMHAYISTTLINTHYEYTTFTWQWKHFQCHKVKQSSRRARPEIAIEITWTQHSSTTERIWTEYITSSLRFEGSKVKVKDTFISGGTQINGEPSKTI